MQCLVAACKVKEHQLCHNTRPVPVSDLLVFCVKCCCLCLADLERWGKEKKASASPRACRRVVQERLPASIRACRRLDVGEYSCKETSCRL